jgi:hypothetical protein
VKGAEILRYIDTQLEEFADYTADAYGVASDDDLLEDKEGDRLVPLAFLPS